MQILDQDLMDSSQSRSTSFHQDYVLFHPVGFP